MISYLLKFWFSVQKIFVLTVQSPFSPLPPSKYLIYEVFFLFHLPWGGGGRNINKCRLEGSSSSLRLNSEYLFVYLLLTLPKNNMNFSHTNRTYHGQSRCNRIHMSGFTRMYIWLRNRHTFTVALAPTLTGSVLMRRFKLFLLSARRRV